MFYATKSYPGLSTDNPSLVVAFCHLLGSAGKDVDPETLANEFSDFTGPTDWYTITSYDNEFGLTSVGRGWPKTRNSIVSFQIADAQGQTTMLYCMMNDPSDQTIIDSTDGIVKSAGIYGTPLQYASYAHVPAVRSEAETIPVTVAPLDTNRYYTVLKGDRMFTIAHKLGISESDLREHNDLDDPYNLKPGTKLRLPVALEPQPEKPQAVIEVYDTALLMHISREGGAQKWHFGNHDSIKDIISGSGMYAQNSEVRIYGQALVPVEGETWAYYLDHVAVGDYATTGRIRYTIGFACGDLSQGPAPTPAIDEPGLSMEQKIAQTIAAIEPEPKHVPAPKPQPVETDEVLAHPNRWRSSYVSFGAPQTFVVDLPDGQEEILVHDHEQKRTSKRLRDNGHYPIAGTFWKDGVEYGRPQQAVQSDPKSWYGIPMSVLKSEKELYDDTPDLATRLALKHHNLSPFERHVLPALAVTSLSYDRLKLYTRKLTNKSKEIK